MKEDLCYVSSNFMPDLKMARSQRLLDPFGGRLKKNFLLPDFATVMRGYVKPDDELPAIDDQVIGPLVPFIFSLPTCINE